MKCFYFARVIWLAALLPGLAGCGAGSGQVDTVKAGQTDPSALAALPLELADAEQIAQFPQPGNPTMQHRSIELPSAMAEIDALAAPADVDAAVFAELKAELARLLGEEINGTSARSASFAYSNRIEYYGDELHVRVNHQTRSLRWLYLFGGDYDQNGSVNAADLVPLALHFGEKADRTAPLDYGWFPAGTLQYVTDGNFDGEINLADIVLIAGNYGRLFEGCLVYGGLTRYPGDSSPGQTEWRVPLDKSTRGLHGQKEFELELAGELVNFYVIDIEDGPAKQYRVRGFGRNGNLYESAYGLMLPVRMTSTHLQYDGSANRASWRHFFAGDGNRDGLINSADLALIGVHLSASVEADTSGVVQYVDYDQNGIISIAEITLLGLYFAGGFEGYSLYYAASAELLPDGYWGDESNAPLLSMGYLELPLPLTTEYELPFTPASGSYLYLRPYLGEELGPVCEFVQVP